MRYCEFEINSNDSLGTNSVHGEMDESDWSAQVLTAKKKARKEETCGSSEGTVPK